jgi:hypothetical protein
LFAIYLFKSYPMNKIFVVFLSVISFTFASAYGQDVADSAYYVSFPDKVTSRFYFSRKYTSVQLKSGAYDLTFIPNTTLNMGIGATYEGITLNLAYGFGFLNPDIGRGDSKYLDLQAHLYPRNFVIDFFGQFHKGFYIPMPEQMSLTGDRFLTFPDMRSQKIGASVQYVFSPDKFSFQAAFLQHEWQQRSGSTLLVGFEMYGGQAVNEQGIVPILFLNALSDGYDRIRFFEFGPNVGYAATLVIKKHFFVTGSLSSNLALGYTTLDKDRANVTEWGVNPNLFTRVFAGYNAERWSINANYVLNTVNLPTVDEVNGAFMTGNYRLNFIYRFLPGPKLKRYLRVIDDTKARYGI